MLAPNPTRRARAQLPPIPPTEEVAAALVDKRYGSHGECEANGIKFHYVETGVAFKGRGPALLFLHGFPEVGQMERGCRFHQHTIEAAIDHLDHN